METSFNRHDQFLVFSLDGNEFALPAGMVARIISAVNITGLPGAKENILGVINLRGQAIPVFNIRKIFNLPPREIRLSDLFIIIQHSGRTISVMADSVRGLSGSRERKIIPAAEVFPGLDEIIEALLIFEDGTVLIYNPEKLFTLQDLVSIDLSVMEKSLSKVQETDTETSGESRKKAGGSKGYANKVKGTAGRSKGNKKISGK